MTSYTFLYLLFYLNYNATIWFLWVFFLCVLFLNIQQDPVWNMFYHICFFLMWKDYIVHLYDTSSVDNKYRISKSDLNRAQSISLIEIAFEKIILLFIMELFFKKMLLLKFTEYLQTFLACFQNDKKWINHLSILDKHVNNDWC